MNINIRNGNASIKLTKFEGRQLRAAAEILRHVAMFEDTPEPLKRAAATCDRYGGKIQSDKDGGLSTLGEVPG